MRDYAKIVETARAHYETVKADIANAKDRYEHIRLTALANQAHHLYTDLLSFEIGLVYTHTASTDAYLSRDVALEEPLDLPEFKSPYIPPQG